MSEHHMNNFPHPLHVAADVYMNKSQHFVSSGYSSCPSVLSLMCQDDASYLTDSKDASSEDKRNDLLGLATR